MNNHNKQKRKRLIVITTVSIILFSAVSLFIGRTNTRIETMFRDSIAFIEYYVIKKPLSVIGDTFNEYYSLKDVYEENAILREKLDNYAIDKSKSEALENELERLKELVDIEYLKTDYQVRYAYVQTRPIDAWNQQMVINIGSTGKVKEGMAVMSSEGMIGTVTSVTELSATVTLLTNEKSVEEIPVEVHNGNQVVHGLLDFYDVKTGRYEIKLIDGKIEKLEKDAKVVTSGMGGDDKSPKGLLIGTAKEMKLEEDGISTKLYAEPAAQFTDLNYVAVVLRLADANE